MSLADSKTPWRNLARRGWDQGGMVAIFLAMFALMALYVPGFFTYRNQENLLLQVSTIGMVACTMLFCLASGDFDLSVESVVVFSGVFAAVVIDRTHSVGLGILCGVLGGGIVGLINGIIIAEFRINALIATLATWQIVKGLAFIVSGGQAVGIPEQEFFLLGQTPRDVLVHAAGAVPSWLDWADAPPGQFGLLRVPNPVWLMLACFAVFAFLLNRTTFGRNTLAIGGNREAARLAGINVNRTKIVIFALQGLVTGFAGVVLAARMTSGQPNTSVGFSLDVISACVLGGVALSGGAGSITGVIVGVLIMGSVQNAMNLLGIDAFYQFVARGAILLAAVLLDQLKKARPTGARPLLLEVLTLAALLLLPILLILNMVQVPDRPTALIDVLVRLAALVAILALRNGRKLSWLIVQAYLAFEVAASTWWVWTATLRPALQGHWPGGFWAWVLFVLTLLPPWLLALTWIYLYRRPVRTYCQVGSR